MAAASPASAQQQLAIPSTVRSVLRSPPAEGTLLRISGYLEIVGQGVAIRDEATGQKIDLDFSKSTVPLDALIRIDGKSPAEITGRMKASTNNGRPSLAVVGGIAGTAVAASGQEHLRLAAETRLQFKLTSSVRVEP
jgi:hypothetical protein